jgi:dienelactone hydrolase
MVEDGCMLFDWMAARAHVDARRIAVVGRSLGSGVAVQVAKERPAHSVVLITPYDSILAIAKRKFRVMPIEYMLRHRFESIKYAPALKAPTYVLRAASDDVVPHSHTDQLVAKLAQLCGRRHRARLGPHEHPLPGRTQSRIANFLTSQFGKPLEPAARDRGGSRFRRQAIATVSPRHRRRRRSSPVPGRSAIPCPAWPPRSRTGRAVDPPSPAELPLSGK